MLNMSYYNNAVINTVNSRYNEALGTSILLCYSRLGYIGNSLYTLQQRYQLVTLK